MKQIVEVTEGVGLESLLGEEVLIMKLESGILKVIQTFKGCTLSVSLFNVNQSNRLELLNKGA